MSMVQAGKFEMNTLAIQVFRWKGKEREREKKGRKNEIVNRASPRSHWPRSP